MEEPREQCTVVCALRVTEPVAISPSPTSRFHKNSNQYKDDSAFFSRFFHMIHVPNRIWIRKDQARKKIVVQGGTINIYSEIQRRSCS
jgi:hypothetical protein